LRLSGTTDQQLAPNRGVAINERDLRTGAGSKERCRHTGRTGADNSEFLCHKDIVSHGRGISEQGAVDEN